MFLCHDPANVKSPPPERNTNKINCKCSATYGDVEHVCGVKTVDRGLTQPGQNKRKLFCTLVGLSVQEQLEKWSTNGKIKGAHENNQSYRISESGDKFG